MSEMVADVLQGEPFGQQVRRTSVPQGMGAEMGQRQPELLLAGLYHLVDPTGSKGTVRVLA